MDLAARLEEGRSDFLEAAGDIPPEMAAARHGTHCWSVLECIEHVAAVEARYLGWLEHGELVAPKVNREREFRLFTKMRSRLIRLETPEVFRPRGRFDTLAAALAEFETVRSRSVHLVRERGGELYSIGVKHPYFGRLNGAELILLMDGHARRHADQMREMREVVQVSQVSQVAQMKPAKFRKPAIFKRDKPDLPEELEAVDDPGRLFEVGESTTIQEKRLQDLQRPNLRVGELRVEGSVLERVQFAGGEFGSAVWKDVRLLGCDLANVRAHRLTLVRVELIDCRLTGFSATAVECKDVLIRKGDLRYSQMQGGGFRGCEFDQCNWQDADLQGADLTGSIIRGCDLARADLRGARLQGADFRLSEVEGMVVGMGDLQGAIVDPGQVMVFARLLGLRIE